MDRVEPNSAIIYIKNFLNKLGTQEEKKPDVFCDPPWNLDQSKIDDLNSLFRDVKISNEKTQNFGWRWVEGVVIIALSVGSNLLDSRLLKAVSLLAVAVLSVHLCLPTVEAKSSMTQEEKDIRNIFRNAVHRINSCRLCRINESEDWEEFQPLASTVSHLCSDLLRKRELKVTLEPELLLEVQQVQNAAWLFLKEASTKPELLPVL